MIQIALFGSLAITPLLFLLMPFRRALVTSYCMLWMFLPVAKIGLPGLPDLDKPSAIGLGVLIAMILFYADLILKKFTLAWYDIPVILFALVIPLTSMFLNGMGTETVLNYAIINFFMWVVPYFAGRLMLGDELGVQELATGIFIAALIYAPLCWFEMLFSPQLHQKIYGYHPSKFNQAVRGWSYRPMMFMSHGLMVAMWLVAGACCGVWLLKHKMLLWRYKRLSPKWAVGFLLFTAAACNSMGAVLLMVIAFAALYSIRWLGPKAVLVPLLLVTPVYMVARSTGAADRDVLTSFFEPISPHRAGSLRFRLYSEDHYVERAMERPIIGWGDHRYRPISDETGREIGASDGLWIIALGRYGIFGLISMVLTFTVIPAILIFKQPWKTWASRRFAPSAVLCVMLMVYAIDNLMNAMINPIYMLAAGALASYATGRVRVDKPARKRTRAARQRTQEQLPPQRLPEPTR